MAEPVNHEIVESIGVIYTKKSGWTREINLVSWNGMDAKFDIRDWSPDHDKMSRGITLTEEEIRKLVELMKERL
ncbi:MAG: PC4/YdbC family ssDNA-binding protein [Eubacterium sp.]|jgi:hypothetical protein|nr:PC4/YdbC family ssDNA-binding protein [Eubacterium sp.]MCH4047383.1 PC4/YdbC family ssDNA-binding protein [Eubacterium sp.]MCH4080480.1 PC4/YdbC family ssDNA-binding protein [Eubacterium sp.]MCI1308033.1 PC4/YdbC family ssDNA-binding protein [Eubacterium sp.]